MKIDEVIHECEHLSNEFDYENMNGNMAYSTYSDFKDSISKIQKWLEENRWIPVSERLPEIGQKVKIRRCSDYYEALYDPKNQFLPWQLIDERDGSVSALFRRREFVDEWQEV